MKPIFSLMAVLCLFFSSGHAHTTVPKQPLSIGDQVPDLALGTLLNSKNPGARLTDYRGRIVILDFWATNCGSCINALPRLEQVQKRFGDSVAIIPVTYEKTAIVQQFLVKNPAGKNLQLPVVTGDQHLAALFPHRMLSHEVWIDPTGTVIAITEAEYVTPKNVYAFLHHRDISLPLKNDRLAFDYGKPLFKASSPTYYRLISPYQAGVAPRFGSQTDSITGSIRTWAVNYPVLTLYKLATGHLLYFPKTLTDIRLKDTTLIYLPKGSYRDIWKQGHYWCYESVMPKGTSPQIINNALLSDLNAAFHLHGGMEKRLARCLMLERLPGGPPLRNSAGGNPVNTLHRRDTLKVLRNTSLSNIIWELNEIRGGLPAIDHTGFSGNTDLDLPVSDFKNISGLNTALQPYGLVLREANAELEYFVLRDADQP